MSRDGAILEMYRISAGQGLWKRYAPTAVRAMRDMRCMREKYAGPDLRLCAGSGTMHRKTLCTPPLTCGYALCVYYVDKRASHSTRLSDVNADGWATA